MSSGGSPFDFSKYTGAGSSTTPEGSQSSSAFAGESNVDMDREINFSDAAFGHGSRPGDSQMMRPPVKWLFLAAAVASIAIVVATTFGGNPFAAISAWILGGPLAIASMAVFTMRDTRARTFVLYSASGLVPWLYGVTLLVSSTAVVMSALRIADWVGRL
jgi:hypothetical protein